MNTPNVIIELTHDQVLLLANLFARSADEDTLAAAHPAEYLVFTHIAAQLDASVSEMIRPDGWEPLEVAQLGVAAGSRHEVEDYLGPKVTAEK